MNVILCFFSSNLCSELVYDLTYACLLLDFIQKPKKKKTQLCELVVWGLVR